MFTPKFNPTSNSNKLFCEIIITNDLQLTNISITIDKLPTGNCQLSSVGNMDKLLDFTQNNKNYRIQILKDAYKLCSDYTPYLVLIDVPESYTKDVEETFNVHEKIPYTNNETPMCLFFITLNKPFKTC